MSTTEPADAAKGRARRDSVADLVYTSFRRRVDNPKHLFYLFPPDYRRQVVQFDPGEEHRANMFKRRNSLRSSTQSDGGSRSKWGRRKQSVADVTAPPANGTPDERKIVRGRSHSVPMVKLEPSGSDDEGPSRLQLRRSTNAYLELMWPRFFGSNRDVHEASERNLSRRHSEAASVHSRHTSGGGGSGSHSRHNSGGGSNSSRHNSDSMTVLEEEGGLHDSGIHGGSSRSSLTSVTSVGDVFLDDDITPASSTHSLHNLKPEVEMRRRAVSQSYLQHRASHNSQGSGSHKSTSERDREEQILNPRALLLSSSSTGEGHGRGLPPRPSSYSGIGNEREKELLQNPSGRLSSDSRLGDELVRMEGNENNPASRPKSDVELRYEDVLEHLMWDVEVPETPPPDPNTEQLTPPASSGFDATKGNVRNDDVAKQGITNDDITNDEVTKYGVTNDDGTKHGISRNDVIKNDVTKDEAITPVSSNQSLQNIPSHPEVDMRRKAFSQSHSKQHSEPNVEQSGIYTAEKPLGNRKTEELNSKPNTTSMRSSRIGDRQGTAQEQLAQTSPKGHGQPYLVSQMQEVASVLNQQDMKYGQDTLDSLAGSRNGSRMETNLDELPSHVTSKTSNNTYSKQAQPAGMSAFRSMDQLYQGEEPYLEPTTQGKEGASVPNQQDMKYGQDTLNYIGGSRNGSKNLDELPSHATSKHNTYSKQAQPAGMHASRSMDPLEQETHLLSSSHSLINKSRMGDPSQRSRRPSSSSLDGDLPTSRSSRMDQLIPNPWYSRYSDSSLNLLDVTPGPECPEAGGTTSTDSDVTEDISNFDISAHHQEAHRGNAGPMQAGNNRGGEDLLQDKQGRGKGQGEAFKYGAEVGKGQGAGLDKALGGDKKTPVMDNTKVDNNQEGYLEDVFMGDDGPGGMLQAMNNPKVTNDMINRDHNNSEHDSGHGSDALKPLMDPNNVVTADKDDTVYTFTSVVEWTRDNEKDNTPSLDGPKPNDDEDSMTYTFSSKVEWNKQSQGGDEKEPLLVQGSAQGASVLQSVLEGREDSDADLEAYLDDVIQKHSSIVLQTEADPQFVTGNAPVSSDDRIRRQSSVGVRANPETLFTTDNAPEFANDNITKQTNFGVHPSIGPQSKRSNRENIPSRGQMGKWKSGNDPEEDKHDSGITEKWTLLSQGHADNTMLKSRSKGYGALRSGDYQDCQVRKGSVKLEKLKTKKVFTFCCFPFEFYW